MSLDALALLSELVSGNFSCSFSHCARLRSEIRTGVCWQNWGQIHLRENIYVDSFGGEKYLLLLSNVIIFLLFSSILTNIENSLFYVYMYVSILHTCIDVYHVHLVLAEVRRVHQSSWHWSSRKLWTVICVLRSKLGSSARTTIVYNCLQLLIHRSIPHCLLSSICYFLFNALSYYSYFIIISNTTIILMNYRCYASSGLSHNQVC